MAPNSGKSLHGICVGYLLDIYWLFVGYLLVVCWIFVGYLLLLHKWVDSHQWTTEYFLRYCI